MARSHRTADLRRRGRRPQLGAVSRSGNTLATPFLSVIIPAFNEELRISSSLDTIVSYLGGRSFSWEVLVVDDGSTDETARMVAQWAESEKRVQVQTVPHRGKGWAVRHGMLATSGELRFMCDADLAMPIEHLSTFLARMAEGYDIVIGSRQKEAARRFDEPVIRHVMGRVFNWIVRSIAVQGFVDTQCGFKCFRGEVAEDLFRLQRAEGFGFDIEILFIAAKRGLRVVEIPIDWYYQPSSKVRPLVDSFAMLRDTIRLRLRDTMGRLYS